MDAYSTGGANSVGVVSPQSFVHDAPFTFRSGKTLPGFTLIYETYGTLNASRSNAVFICHALSGNHHVAGVHADQPNSYGWWDNAIGPGQTHRYQPFLCGLLQ